MKRQIVFSGHMIDTANREEPRFPASAESKVKAAILHKLTSIPEIAGAIAGGACGGDIIFHEVCLELGIPAVLFLALPLKEFKKHSVSFAGADWDYRFDRLVDVLPIQYPNYTDTSVWENANEEMLDRALNTGDQIEILVLLNPAQEGQAGGSAHMLTLAQNHHIEPEIIDLGLLL